MILFVLGYNMCSFSVSVVFFFFKQKTAYEMRISDWSSDVCSSDLRHLRARRGYSGRDHVTRIGTHVVDQLGAALAHRRPHDSAAHRQPVDMEIGRASCRERVCQYV